MERELVEAALDRGHLWVMMTNGRYWQLRRNGQTQLWKREPRRFRIPVKAGLRVYDEINDNTPIVFGHKGHFAITHGNANSEPLPTSRFEYELRVKGA